MRTFRTTTCSRKTVRRMHCRRMRQHPRPGSRRGGPVSSPVSTEALAGTPEVLCQSWTKKCPPAKRPLPSPAAPAWCTLCALRVPGAFNLPSRLFLSGRGTKKEGEGGRSFYPVNLFPSFIRLLVFELLLHARMSVS